MIRAVIFDFDGVLIDSEPVYVKRKQEYLLSYNINVPETESRKFAGNRCQPAVMEMDLGISLEERTILAEHYCPITDLDYPMLMFPDVIETLTELKSMDIKTAIASNSPQDKLDEAVRQCGMQDLIDICISSSQVSHLKPAPDVYLEVVRRLRFTPDQCIAVEDSDCGLQSAVSSGCRTICKKENRFGFSQKLGEFKIDSLSEIPGYIKKYNMGLEEQAYETSNYS